MSLAKFSGITDKMLLIFANSEQVLQNWCLMECCHDIALSYRFLKL